MEKIGRAVFISCAEEGEALPVFRKTFCAKKVLSATLYATALGCYVAFLNGKRIGNFELEPGFDEMAKRKSYTAYDVTELLSEGENALTAVVGSGWWSGRVAACYGKETAFCARLVLRHADGKEEIVTDGSWKSARKSGRRRKRKRRGRPTGVFPRRKLRSSSVRRRASAEKRR